MFDVLFNFLRKSLVAVLFVVFGFVTTYIPQAPASNVNTAHASVGGFGGATEITQIANNVLLGNEVVQSTITAGATASNWLKENTLDTIGWAIAQRMVATIIRDTLSWVASGFDNNSRPGFVTDLRATLLQAADEEFGSIIEGFGGIGSFICAPFQLDVQIAIATQYNRSRDTQQSAPSCTLTGIVDNIQGFISGTDPAGGLSDWIQITATPQTYTPYGAVLSAQATARARLINARGEELNLLGFGDGFLSAEVCRDVVGAPSESNASECSIVTPGKVISEQVNKAMGLPADLAITADEINEAIVLGLTTLVSKAFTGSAGVLGLSGNDGFGGYTGENFLESTLAETDAAIDGSGNIIETTGSNEETFRDEAQSLRGSFAAYALTAIDAASKSRAETVVSEIDAALEAANENINELNILNGRYDSAENGSSEQIGVLNEYSALSPSFVGGLRGEQQINNWQITASSLGIELPEAE